MGTDARQPAAHVMFNGHQDGIRGIAGANCAYIGPVVGRLDPGDRDRRMQTSRSGWRRRRRYVR